MLELADRADVDTLYLSSEVLLVMSVVFTKDVPVDGQRRI